METADGAVVEVIEVEDEVEDEIDEEVELVDEDEAEEVELPAELDAEAEAEAIDTAPPPTDMGVTLEFAPAAFWYQGFPNISATFPTCHPIC